MAAPSYCTRRSARACPGLNLSWQRTHDWILGKHCLSVAFSGNLIKADASQVKRSPVFCSALLASRLSRENREPCNSVKKQLEGLALRRHPCPVDCYGADTPHVPAPTSNIVRVLQLNHMRPANPAAKKSQRADREALHLR